MALVELSLLFAALSVSREHYGTIPYHIVPLCPRSLLYSILMVWYGGTIVLKKKVLLIIVVREHKRKKNRERRTQTV
jgi:hypothetical protein